MNIRARTDAVRDVTRSRFAESLQVTVDLLQSKYPDYAAGKSWAVIARAAAWRIGTQRGYGPTAMRKLRSLLRDYLTELDYSARVVIATTGPWSAEDDVGFTGFELCAFADYAWGKEPS